MNFNCIIKTGLVAVAAMVSLSSFSQDLIARQAPIDKKLKTVDSLALQKQIRAEQSEYPALSLYPNWNNQYAHAYGNAIIPDTYTIDLTGFCMPTPSTKITSPFGPRWRRMHNGLDLKVNIGDTIVAAFDGKVRIVKYERRGYGKYVVIRHDNGLETIYGHLSKQLVEENQLVKAGEVIGLGGNTGRSTGSHLHFETRFLGIAINPIYMFDFPKQDIVADTYTFRKTKGVRSAGSVTPRFGPTAFRSINAGCMVIKIPMNSTATSSMAPQVKLFLVRTSFLVVLKDKNAAARIIAISISVG